MSELARKRHEREGYLDPEELSSVELINAFFSELRHPGMATRSSRELAKFIASHLGGTDGSELSHDQTAWRERMMELMVDAADADNDTFDRWLEDEPFLTAYSAIRKIVSSKNRVEKETERTALTEVWNLRAGVLERNEADGTQDEEWLRLIERLTPAN